MGGHPVISEVETESEHFNDTELERVQRFEEMLGHLSSVRTLDFRLDLQRDNEPVEAAVQRFLSYDYTGKPELFIADDQGDFSDVDVNFFAPRIARGGKRSNHGVFFGDLRFDDETSLAVAVKPYTEAANLACLRDHGNNVAARALGFSSLKPIGFLLEGNERAYSMTKLDEDITTLDTIDWSQFYPNFTNNPGMIMIFSQIARRMALIHAEGNKNHGDLAGRNIAVTTDDQVFFIDWEKANISLKPPRDAEVRYSNSHADLSVLLESLCLPPHADFKAGLGVFFGKGGDWWEGFCELIFNEYIDLREVMADAGSHHKRVKADIKEELDQLTISLRKGMEMERDICTML